jgi:cholesterol 7-dehydrogenase
LGSGLVYIFVKSYFFTITYFQYVQTDGKFTQNLYHDIYTSKWFPYWLSAIFLKVESLQVLNDGYVWDAKQFKRKTIYQKDSAGDESMRKWREWYYQFYDGCK